MEYKSKNCKNCGLVRSESEKKYYTGTWLIVTFLVAFFTGGLGLLLIIPIWFFFIVIKLVTPRDWRCPKCGFRC